ALTGYAPDLRQMIPVLNGHAQPYHVYFVRALQPGDAHEIELILPIGSGDGSRLHDRLVALRTEVRHHDAVVIEGVHGDHFRLTFGLQALHQDTTCSHDFVA